MVPIQKGYSLVELMVVVGIIAILAAIAIPLFMNYASVAEGAEGYALGGALKSSIVTRFNNLGKWPTDNNSAGVATANSITGTYVKSVTVTSGSQGSLITVLFKSKGVAKSLQGKNLYLAAMNAGGSVKWECEVDSTNMYKYVPSTCRNKR